MKIAVAAKQKNEDSEISALGARAPYYLIFDENALLIDALEGFNFSGEGGAGIAAADFFSEENVDIFIAGDIGPKMSVALEQKGIKHIEKKGIAREVVKNLELIELKM